MSDQRNPENPNPDPGHKSGDLGQGSFDQTHKGDEQPSTQGPTKVKIPHHDEEEGGSKEGA